MKDNITFKDACKLLGKSRRTVSRYIKKGLLNPDRIRNKLGTLEYRFNQVDLLKLKKTKRTKKTKSENDIMAFLKNQIKVKDEQIKELQERSRETNIMFNRLQNQLLLTEGNKEVKEDKEDRQDKERKGINGWWKRLFYKKD